MPAWQNKRPTKTRLDYEKIEALVPDGAKVLATSEGHASVLVSEFGKGRSFTLLLGHAAAFMATPGFQTLLCRGTEWAATGMVTQKVPADFPRADAVSLR